MALLATTTRPNGHGANLLALAGDTERRLAHGSCVRLRIRQPPLHCLPAHGVDDCALRRHPSAAEARIQVATERSSIPSGIPRIRDLCIFSRPSRVSSPAAARPSTSARPRATSSSCRPPTRNAPRWRRRAGCSARQDEPVAAVVFYRALVQVDWFDERTAGARRRMWKVMIATLARKLLIALRR